MKDKHIKMLNTIWWWPDLKMGGPISCDPSGWYRREWTQFSKRGLITTYSASLTLCKQEWRIRYSGAGRLHRNTQWVQFAECASSAPFSSMEPNNCGRSGHRSKWSSLCGWFCGDNSGWLIADCAEDYRATSIARSVNRNLKCFDNLKLQGKSGLESLDMPTCRYRWRLPRPLAGGTSFAPVETRSTSKGLDTLHVDHLAHLERMAAFSTRRTNANAAAQSNQRGRTLVPSQCRSTQHPRCLLLSGSSS